MQKANAEADKKQPKEEVTIFGNEVDQAIFATEKDYQRKQKECKASTERDATPIYLDET